MGTPGAGALRRRLQGMFTASLGNLCHGDFCGFPHSIHKCGQIITAGHAGLAGKVQADYFPSQRDRQPGGMGVAQVIAVGFSVCCQRPQHGGGISIDIRQGGNSCLTAR